MAQRIIFPNDSGTISVIIPAIDIASCLKDVPTGKPYRIVDETEIPTDRMQRQAWTADFTNPDGHGA